MKVDTPRHHVVMFVHSLVSDWNHGNAHFLRGIASELQAQGHRVSVFEPQAGWSRTSLIAECGAEAVETFHTAFPDLRSTSYVEGQLDLDAVLHDASVVLVHEWNDPDLVRRIGAHRTRTSHYLAFFHDTHHRLVSDPAAMSAFDVSGYDGILAFGAVLRDRYAAMGWGRRAYTWHEAADTRRFFPIPTIAPTHDVVWIGNWGDDERTHELDDFLLYPARTLKLDTVVHGVRYPPDALQRLRQAGIDYEGWIPNHEVPRAFAHARLTVHVPRRFYVDVLPGIPTIRVFEALACGVPLISAPWEDIEGLFTPGSDFAIARTRRGMVEHLALLLRDRDRALAMAEHGRRTILARHTCAHRVNELLTIVTDLC